MTTNIELINIAKSLCIPNFYCIMIDELDKVLTSSFPISIICNLQDSSENGSHWVMCFISSKSKRLGFHPTKRLGFYPTKIFYCSYGSPIPNKIKNFLMKINTDPILSSNFQIQDFNENTCGYYCLLILYLLNEGLNFEDIILSLKDK